MRARHAGSENFPVASRLLPARVRPHVMAFYAFARAADDIADTPGFSPDEKRDILQLWSQQLDAGGEDICRPVADLRQSLKETGVRTIHAQDLLRAFLRDVENPRTASWEDLMGYCRLSAAPVGRYLIDLMDGGAAHGEDAAYAASDALCAALQVLNHIQDVKDDHAHLARVYVPADWMAEAGVSEADLGRDQVTPELRTVLDRMLDGVEALLVEAKPLPGQIRTKALAREAGGILAIAWRLARTLRHKDPLAGRIVLPKPMAALWFLWGALTA